MDDPAASARERCPQRLLPLSCSPRPRPVRGPDGTLLDTDLLYESLLVLLARNPLYLFLLPFWLLQGKAALKRQIAARVTIDPRRLPYNPKVLELLRDTAQRPRVLCTASDQLLVAPIAAHLGLFEQVIASDGQHNLSGTHKAQAWWMPSASVVSTTPAMARSIWRSGPALQAPGGQQPQRPPVPQRNAPSCWGTGPPHPGCRHG